ncbi:MAG: tetraacyldisaccharide 4'-kinase [Deltaproteobacteria bacterium]|jgi:tetraacyldisaccharide 4'-kinase|nr:tetraacyldisaccharide 4'-kinase [Deltaproteobacteria bacterium]
MNHRKAQQVLSFILTPLSKGYATLMRRRAAAYGRDPAKSSRPKGFCISVGNIAWGGSGKTPLVSWLLDWAKASGRKATVLTRGYGGKSARRPLPVTRECRPSESGDEPLLLALSHPEAQILADPLRRRALAWAEEHSSPGSASLYLLDDGMQHLAIRRDLNLVLLRAADLGADWNRVIPAGPWREGAEALARADAFLLRASPAGFAALEAGVRTRLERFGKPVFCFDLHPQGLIPLSSWLAAAAQPPLAASLPPAYNLCTAVGTPASVIAGARQLLGKAAERELIFPDHYAYRPKDLKSLEQAALPLVVTGKDAVKMLDAQKIAPELEILVLQSGLEFGPRLFAYKMFPDWLDDKIAGYTAG